MRGPHVTGISAAALLLAIVTGCVVTSPGPADGTVPPSVPTDPTSGASPDLSGLDEATASAIVIRNSYGLRADIDYIRAIAKDPTATSEFGTPLTPAEIA